MIVRGHNSEWSEQLVQDLRDLWAQGLSTAEIGVRLNLSKNAVVGKAHRLDLPGRPSPIIRRDRPAPIPPPSVPRQQITLPPLASAAVATALAAPRPVVFISRPVIPDFYRAAPRQPPTPPAPRVQPQPAPRIVRRSPPTCCWPIGEPRSKTFRFCDGPSSPGKPYCDDHAKLAYLRIRDRRDDADIVSAA